MSDEKKEKYYTSVKIPKPTPHPDVGPASPCQNPAFMAHSDEYYEIEYDSSPIPGVGKFVKKPLKLQPPERDEIRDLFFKMRNLSRSYSSIYATNRFFDKRVHEQNAAIFYKQAVFMKDFSDNYHKTVSLSQYFPFYQLMGYEQLRTYFTWRTAVRKGNITDISLSYAFLYIYELLDNIGVSSPEEGLDSLMFFWKAFREYDSSIDKYLLRWIKDYHVYYEMPLPFREFIAENQLTQYYPNLYNSEDSFALFASISKYNMKKSTFYTDENAPLIQDCFNFLIRRLRSLYAEHGIAFDETVFVPTRKMTVWKPFSGALFHPWLKQSDRKIILSENEIYICKDNRWTFSTVLTNETGRRLIGYIMKQMEVALRKAVKYKYKLSADICALEHESVTILKNAGISLEEVINHTVSEFYREATKIVVKVDTNALLRIRREALKTQEKLIVEEEPEPAPPIQEPPAFATEEKDESSPPISAGMPQNEFSELKISLSDIELEALEILLKDPGSIKQLADKHGLMLEVLCDGINDKAMDFIGDNLLDEELLIYDDYFEQVKELVGLI